MDGKESSTDDGNVGKIQIDMHECISENEVESSTHSKLLFSIYAPLYSNLLYSILILEICYQIMPNLSKTSKK
jgi:hypothetical protein